MDVMASSKDYYVVSGQLRAYPLAYLLKHREQIATLSGRAAAPDLIDDAVPVSADGKLQFDTLYPSSADSSVRFYLPRYELRTARGCHTTSLRLRGSGDDPAGPLGWLTVELLAVAPNDVHHTLREIGHQATLRIGYRMPVAERNEVDNAAPRTTPLRLNRPVAVRLARGAPARRPLQVTMDAFEGTWRNADADTRGLTRLEIHKIDSRNGRLRGFGKCHPRDCDWGETPVRVVGSELQASYDFGFKKTTLSLSNSGDQLIATVLDDYPESDRRSDRSTRYVLTHATTELVDDRPTLWLDVGALEAVSDHVRRCRLAIHTREEYDRLYGIMTDEELGAFLEVRCDAVVDHRTWNQVVVGDLNAKAERKALTLKKAQVLDARKLKAVTPVSSSRPLQPAARRFAFLRNVRPVTPRSSATQIPAPPPIAMAQPVRINMAVLAARTRMFTTVGAVKKQVVPTKALVDKKGEPVLVRSPVTASLRVSPFWFDPASHDYMFDEPKEPAENHILFRDTVTSEGETYTFYQDSAFRDQYYYEPQEFRLARIDEIPYSPDLLVAFLDATTAEDGGEVTYRVRLSYRARPYLSPRVIEIARVQLEEGKAARFTALEPVASRLSLRLQKDDAGGDFQTVERDDAEIEFDSGIVDTLDLSSSEFERIFAAFQNSGLGFEGDVEATLFDGSEVRIPLVANLRHPSGRVLSSSFQGPAADGPAGRYLMRLDNRIESPVVIDALYGVALGEGITAHPVDADLPLRVPVGGDVVLQYQVTPAEAPVVDIEPGLSASIEVDNGTLWPLVMVNEGYTSKTFPVQTSIDRIYFDTTPPGMQLLQAVEVDFDSDVSVRLTPDVLQQTVQLRMPLLPWLMKQPEAKRYRYRVTNYHGDDPGDQGPWQDGEGELPLQIVPAGVGGS